MTRLCVACQRPNTKEYHHFPERDGDTGFCRSVPLSVWMKDLEEKETDYYEREEGDRG